MNPETAALVADLEHQRARLRQIRERLRATERVLPGESTFWTGLARAAYEMLVVRLTAALNDADDALETAVKKTSLAIGTLGG